MKDEETIFQYLKKVKRKLRINKSIKSLLIFASIGAVLSALIMGYSKIFPFYYAVPAALIAAGALVVTGIFYVLFKKISNKSAAKVLDAVIGNEKISTAVEYMKSEGTIVKKQRSDAAAALRGYGSIAVDKLKLFDKKTAILSLILLV